MLCAFYAILHFRLSRECVVSFIKRSFSIFSSWFILFFFLGDASFRFEDWCKIFKNLCFIPSFAFYVLGSSDLQVVDFFLRRRFFFRTSRAANCSIGMWETLAICQLCKLCQRSRLRVFSNQCTFLTRLFPFPYTVRIEKCQIDVWGTSVIGKLQSFLNFVSLLGTLIEVSSDFFFLLLLCGLLG